jgi:hypothetical protein
VILDHRAAVGGRQASTGGKLTATGETGGWGSLALGSERRKRETKPRRVKVGEGGLWWVTDGHDVGMSKRRGGLAESASGSGAVGGAARGESRLVAGVGNAPLTADHWGGGASVWAFGLLSYWTFTGLYV